MLNELNLLNLLCSESRNQVEGILEVCSEEKRIEARICEWLRGRRVEQQTALEVMKADELKYPSFQNK